MVTLVTRPVAVSTLAASGQKQSQLWQTTDLVIVAGWLDVMEACRRSKARSLVEFREAFVRGVVADGLVPSRTLTCQLQFVIRLNRSGAPTDVSADAHEREAELIAAFAVAEAPIRVAPDVALDEFGIVGSDQGVPQFRNP